MPSILLAQDKGFSTLNNTTTLQNALAKKASKTNTIKSDFIQIKNMKMLQNKVISKGLFYYSQPDKIRIEYTSPFQYLLVMNGNNISIKDDGKVNKINMRNSNAMRAINQVMLDCMKGTVFKNNDFLMKAFVSNTKYLLTLSPLDSEMKKMFSDIQVYMNKDDLLVSELIMNQRNGDNTTMKFNSVQTNVTLSDTLFFIR